jgi:DNA-binding NarL/FixJ family response regulator
VYDSNNFEIRREHRAEPLREAQRNLGGAADRRGENLNDAGTGTIRLLLVDDRPTIRRGLRIWLALQPNMEVVGEASDGAEGLSLARALRPDVVLMDVEMPGMDGISATAALRQVVPQSAVVILTLYDDAATRTRAQEAGAAAFVAKHQMEETLLAEIRRVVMAHEKQRRHERPVERHGGSEA